MKRESQNFGESKIPIDCHESANADSCNDNILIDSRESCADSPKNCESCEAKCETKEGFNFAFNPAKCESCGGKCCIGESGFVFLSKAEMARIADFLGLDFGAFTKRFIRQVGARYSLIEKPHKSGFACVFFDDIKRCTIYPVRPTQCKKFPFWDIFKNNAQGAFRECEGVETL